MSNWDKEHWNKEQRLMDQEAREDRYRRYAKKRYADPSDDNIEIDSDATVSPTEETAVPAPGAWVAAWLWCPKNEVEEKDEDD